MRGLWVTLVLILCHPAVAVSGVTVLGGLARENTARPGDMYDDTILLKNTDGWACDVEIYQTDYAFYSDGVTVYGEPGSMERSNAEWISLAPPRLTIPANSTLPVHYRVEVPEAVNLGGSHWSIIMIESVESAGLQGVTDASGQNRVAVQTRIRYGVQVVTDLGDEAKPDIRFQDKRLVHEEAMKVLEVDLENTGDRWLSPGFSVELYDQEGKLAYRFESERKRIYPGCSVRHSIDVTGVPAGRYTALAIVAGGTEEDFGAQYDLWID
jgi:hypothetical protein